MTGINLFLLFSIYLLFICLLSLFWLCSVRNGWGYVCTCGGTMLVFSSAALILFFEVGSPKNLELTLPPTLSGYLAPRIFLPLPRSSTGVGGRHHTQLSCGCRGLSSGPCASVTSAVLLCSGCALLSVSPHWGKDGLFGLSLALRDQSAISFWFQF